jgi:hypothetical protein
MADIKQKVWNLQQSTWTTSLYSKPKLRTYKTFKSTLETEWYVRSRLSRTKRSLLAQLRAGVLPLKVETGRFRRIPLDQRRCEICNSGKVEDERHFVCECPQYKYTRDILYEKVINNQNINFSDYSNEDKFIYLMSHAQKYLANFTEKAWFNRRYFLYKQT